MALHLAHVPTHSTEVKYTTKLFTFQQPGAHQSRFFNTIDHPDILQSHLSTKNGILMPGLGGKRAVAKMSIIDSEKFH